MAQGDMTGVVGAGLMGAEIALIQALAGHDVLLADRRAELLDRALARLATLTEKGVARGFYDADAVEAALQRIRTTTDLTTFSGCNFVTEAVFEDLAVKGEVLRALDAALPAHAVIATNTSTIPISVLAAKVGEARRPHFVGMHYFSPVSRMKLVEVIPAFDTAEATIAVAYALAERSGKTAIRVKDVPGFAVNRVLHTFLIEAVRLVEEEVISVEDLNIACRLGLGHPIGPFELMDATTSSLCLTAQQIMFEAYGERFRPRPLLKQRVAAGYTGGKGCRGWA
jgi:3-hydroxybutyryl-CoA dehydrogenase